MNHDDDIDKKLAEKYKDVKTINLSDYGMYDDGCNYYVPDDLKEYLKNKKHTCSDKDYDKIVQLHEKIGKLKKKINTKRNKETIKETEKEIENIINPNSMYERLGVDCISILVGKELLKCADPENGGSLIPNIFSLRKKLTDNLGYIIPLVRIMDAEKLMDYEYQILIRGKKVFKGILKKEYAKKNDCSKIIKDLENVCIKYAKQIMCKRDVLKLMELVMSSDPTLVNDLVPYFLTPLDLKEIFVILIQKGVPIKDIIYIFEILNDKARYTRDTRQLARIIEEELSFNVNAFDKKTKSSNISRIKQDN